MPIVATMIRLYTENEDRIDLDRIQRYCVIPCKEYHIFKPAEISWEMRIWWKEGDWEDFEYSSREALDKDLKKLDNMLGVRGEKK